MNCGLLTFVDDDEKVNDELPKLNLGRLPNKGYNYDTAMLAMRTNTKEIDALTF